MDRNDYFVISALVQGGQARKSLWIETEELQVDTKSFGGQARKSLWIETSDTDSGMAISGVRLVRACGSKHNSTNRRK